MNECIHGENIMENRFQTTLLVRMYDEALKLMDHARLYAQDHGPMDFMNADGDHGLLIAMETTRVSSRLTQVIAWYLTQKAYLDGQTTLSEARNEANKVDYSGELSNRDSENNQSLPSELAYLLRESHGLYERVCRLDEVFWRNTAA